MRLNKIVSFFELSLMKKLNLVIDIGNTHIVIGVYENQELIHFWRLHSDSEKTEDEYFTSLYTLFQQVNISLHNITNIAIDSVVPGLTRAFEHLSHKYLSAKLQVNLPKNERIVEVSSSPDVVMSVGAAVVAEI